MGAVRPRSATTMTKLKQTGSRRPEYRALPWLVLAALGAVLMAGAPDAVAVAWKPSPQDPMNPHWFRTDVPVPGKAHAMDARLQEISDAFGRGEYQESRRLAESLILSAPEAHEGSVPHALLAEAASFIIQSHLAEGDFGSARTAAEGLETMSRGTYHEAIIRIQEAEALHEARIPRLQHIIATCAQPGAVARARRELARIRLCAGEGHEALRDYYQLIADQPASPEAQEAVRAIAAVTLQFLDADSAASILTWLKHQHRNTPTSAMAAYELAGKLREDSIFFLRLEL